MNNVYNAMIDRVDIVIGDDCMGLYRNGELVCAATRLTFGDMLESLDIPCDIWEGDIDEYDDPTKLPKDFKAVKMLEDIVH